MKKILTIVSIVATTMLANLAFAEKPVECFESRTGWLAGTEVDNSGEMPNIKCSPTTGALLWWNDPFEGTIPMGDMPLDADYQHAEAVVKPREDTMTLIEPCGVACHNGTYPELPLNNEPRSLIMHTDLVPDATNLQHGGGAIWCLDCHNRDERDKLVDNFDNAISFNQPQKVCGSCHGSEYQDWRGGIHGKRIGEWATDGKKRWFTCTECHNPHDVQQGAKESGFAYIHSEPAPMLPKGLENADHERHGSDAHDTEETGH